MSKNYRSLTLYPSAKAFDFTQGQITKRFFNPFWKITEWLTGEARVMRDAIKILDDFAYKIIAEREAQGLGNLVGKEKTGTTGTQRQDLLSLYMALRDENGQPMSRKALR